MEIARAHNARSTVRQRLLALAVPLAALAGGIGAALPAHADVPTIVQNNTAGTFADNQIYVTILGKDPVTGNLAWVNADGQLVPAAVGDNDADGHLTKDGQNYPNRGFTLAQAANLKLPRMSSGRIYVSVGEPVYLKLLVAADGLLGFAGPNPQNPSDANNDVKLDWYEFTYNDSGLWINTTQVDQFGFPLTLEVSGDGGFHKRVGIEQSRAAIYSAYKAEVPPEFSSEADADIRIVAPGKSSFDTGQPNEHYFDAYIDQAWADYATRPLTIDLWGGARRFSGQVQGTTLVFNEVDLGNGAFKGGTYLVQKPTTQDVLEAKGSLAQGNDEEKALETQISAAFNRHVISDVSKWSDPTAWYQGAPANYYAKFWHDHSIDRLAYGFAYDDAQEQSSTVNTGAPTQIVLGIGW
ncbi:MAG: glycoside hydrolase family 64 protein [Luteibacter sp.]